MNEAYTFCKHSVYTCRGIIVCSALFRIYRPVCQIVFKYDGSCKTVSVCHKFADKL